MRLAHLALFFATALLAGCSGTPPQRAEPSEITGTVKLPGGKSAKNLVLTLRPTENAQPGGGKCADNGSFTAKVVPGKYIPYFDVEANAGVPAFKDVPQAYKSPKEENAVTVSAGAPLSIEVK
jgi:hypothetical protein